MPSKVSYGSMRLIPGPFVDIQKTYQTTQDGEKIGSIFNISVQGTICVDKGSPNSSGEFYTGSTYPADETIAAESRLGAILRKQKALRALFDADGLSFEIQSADGSAPLKCNPRIVSIDFQQDIWFNRCEYTINMEADSLLINDLPVEDGFTDKILSASENWSFDTDEERNGWDASTYRLTHSINAQGKRFFNADTSLSMPAWQQARNWVQNRLGFDSTFASSSGLNNLPSYYNGYNHIRNEQIDELGGTYSVVESWVLSSGTAIEDFEVNISNQAGAYTQVSLQGSIRGLDEKDSNHQLVHSRIYNAEAKWSGVQNILLSRAQDYSGFSLNITPLSTSIGKNPVAGTIQYSYQFDNRPSNSISGTISETISIIDSRGVDVFAVIPVLGRQEGPVLQGINTFREKTRSLNMELVFSPINGTFIERLSTNHPMHKYPTSGQITDIISGLTPIGYQVFIANNEETWDGVRFSKQIQWVYEE